MMRLWVSEFIESSTMKIRLQVRPTAMTYTHKSSILFEESLRAEKNEPDDLYPYRP